jgi:hypothetical protein
MQVRSRYTALGAGSSKLAATQQHAQHTLLAAETTVAHLCGHVCVVARVQHAVTCAA